MKAVDLDIAVLACEVLFNLCVPSNSIVNTLNDDYNDLVEVKLKSTIKSTIRCISL